MFLGTIHICELLPERYSQLGCAFNPGSGLVMEEEEWRWLEYHSPRGDRVIYVHVSL